MHFSEDFFRPELLVLIRVADPGRVYTDLDLTPNFEKNPDPNHLNTIIVSIKIKFHNKRFKKLRIVFHHNFG